MIDLSKLTYLIIFKDGNTLFGKKKEEYELHKDILKDMQKENEEFYYITKQYDLEDKKDQNKLYVDLVEQGAIVMQAWSTTIEDNTQNINFYMPNMVTEEQKEIILSLKEQISKQAQLNIGNMKDEKRKYFTEICDISDMNFSKLEEYMNEHTVKIK